MTMKGGESESSKTAIGVKQVCIMSILAFQVCMAQVMKETEMELGRMGVIFSEEGGEWRSFGLSYSSDPLLYVELREDTRN